jgi:hypothetical protein
LFPLQFLIRISWQLSHNCPFRNLQFFRGSGWWNGEITSYDGKFYRIIYEDGDTETASEKELASIVLSPELARMEIGCRVAVRWPNDGKYYNGTVCRERNTEKPFCVAYDSGDYEWIDFHRRKFRLLEGADERKSVPPAGSIILSRLQNLPGKKYAIGTKVEKVSMGVQPCAHFACCSY